MGSVSKKLNSLEKHLRHSHADLKAANANPVSQIQILLPDELDGDDDLGMYFDESISLMDSKSTLVIRETQTNPQ